VSEGTYTNLLGVTIDGRPLTPTLKTLLVEGRVDTGLNVPAAFQLTFRDPHRRVTTLLGAKIGAKVQLRAYAVGKDGGGPLFTGEVTALEADFDSSGKYTVVRGHDPGHRLLRNRRVEAYINMTASDIARKLATKNQLKIGRIDPTKTVYDQITQPNITDWEFLNGLARDNDMGLYFTDLGEFRFTKPTPASGAPGGTKARQSPYILEFGVNLLRCRTGVTAADQVGSVEVRGWDPTTKRALTARSPATSNPELNIGLTSGQATTRFGKATLTETGVPYDTQREVMGAAAAGAADVSSAFAELEAVVRGDPKLRPGLPVTLSGIGAPFEGKYTVTTTRHVFGTGERYETWVTVTGEQHRSLFGLTSGGAETTPRLPGVAPAIVTNVRDPLRRGRVRLRFPWLSDTYVSGWARVMQHGGVRGGGLIMPEVNDEVLVGFDRGALDHPYVLGGLYNGVDQLPTYQRTALVGPGGKINWRSIASRSGHRMELLDAPTKKGVTLSTGDDRLTIEMSQVGTKLTVHSDGTVTIEGTRGVSVNTGGDLSLKAAGGVSITAGRDIQLTTAGMLRATAAAAMQLTSPTTIGATALSIQLMGLVTADGQPVMVV
jgi:phage protein D